MDTNGQPLTDDAELDKVLQGHARWWRVDHGYTIWPEFRTDTRAGTGRSTVAANPVQADPVVDVAALPPVDTPVAPVEPAPAPVVEPVYSAGDSSLDAIKRRP